MLANVSHSPVSTARFRRPLPVVDARRAAPTLLARPYSFAPALPLALTI